MGTHNHLISIFGCAGGIFGFISVSFFLYPLSLYYYCSLHLCKCYPEREIQKVLTLSFNMSSEIFKLLCWLILQPTSRTFLGQLYWKQQPHTCTAVLLCIFNWSWVFTTEWHWRPTNEMRVIAVNCNFHLIGLHPHYFAVNVALVWIMNIPRNKIQKPAC